MSWNNKPRSQADKRADFAAAHAADEMALRKAQWEQKSTQLIASNELKRRMNKANQEEEKKLFIRRQRLAALLQAEHDAYTAEIESSIETDDQRRERMIQEARRLQRAREQKRREEVEAIREEQFRASLDDFRTRKSRAIRMQCAQERLTQLEEQKRLAEQEEEEKARFHKEYMKTADRMLARELREAEVHRAKNDEVVQMIAGQIKLKKKFQEQEEEEEAFAVEEWRARLKQQEIEEQRKEKAKLERRIRMDREVAEQNKTRLGRYAKIEAEDKALDMKLLQEALQAEAADKKRDAERKAAAVEENRRFQEFLKMQMQREAEDNSELDRILKAENDLSWEKKESVWNREAAARAKLQAEVERSRETQIHVRDERREEEEVAKKAEIQRLARLHQEGLADDARKRQLRNNDLSKYRQQLTAQVAMRKDAARAIRDEEVQEKLALKAQYDAFDKKVEKVFQSDYKPPANYRRKKVEWYS